MLALCLGWISLGWDDYCVVKTESNRVNLMLKTAKHEIKPTSGLYQTLRKNSSLNTSVLRLQPCGCSKPPSASCAQQVGAAKGIHIHHSDGRASSSWAQGSSSASVVLLFSFPMENWLQTPEHIVCGWGCAGEIPHCLISVTEKAGGSSCSTAQRCSTSGRSAGIPWEML